MLLNENEVIKALNLCLNTDSGCSNCPLDKVTLCKTVLYYYTVDYIEDLKSDINKYKSIIDNANAIITELNLMLDEYKNQQKDSNDVLCDKCIYQDDCKIEKAFNSARMPDKFKYCAKGKRKPTEIRRFINYED